MRLKIDSACQSKNQAMRSKELSVERRDRIVPRSGEGYKNKSAAFNVPNNTMASIILKWKKFGTTKIRDKGIPINMAFFTHNCAQVQKGLGGEGAWSGR